MGKGAEVLVLLCPSLLLVGIVLLGVQSLDTARPHRPSATGSLKQIGLAILMYADENAERLPPTLGATFAYLLDGSVYVVPGSDLPTPGNEADVDSGRCDFLYFGEGKTDWEDFGEVVVATTKPSMFGSEGYVCVLYRDGHVEMHRSVPDGVKALWEAYPNGRPPEATPSKQPDRSD